MIMKTASQPSLFDAVGFVDDQQVASARTRMRAMIDRLKATSEPFWKDDMAVILDDGAFQRAMRLVPPDEAQSLWAEFDVQMERLYAIWAAARTPPSETA